MGVSSALEPLPRRTKGETPTGFRQLAADGVRVPTNRTESKIPVNSPLSAPVMGVSAVTDGDPDNPTLCRDNASSGTVNASSVTPDYPTAGYSKCRLVVERDDYRTNSAAHLEISGASCNGLALLNIKGLAGYVQIAIAGDNLTDLLNALGRLIPPDAAMAP